MPLPNTPATSSTAALLRADPLASIFLIGCRGAGKTTVARCLAQRLGWPWIDADQVLQDRYHTDIRTIFDQEGEASFRDKETLLLAELCGLSRHVIATGGGVILRAVNRNRLHERGIVVWLKADAATLWQRLQADPATGPQRPPLGAGGLEEMVTILREREPLYRACAQLEVITSARTPDEVVNDIMAAQPAVGSLRAGEGAFE
jgi:shikimate kinase